MVTFVAHRFSSTLDPTGFLAFTDPGVVFAENSATHVVVTGSFSGLILTGTGFTYDSSGRPTGGTVTAIDGSFGGLQEYRLSELSLAMSDLLALTSVDQLHGLMADVFSGNDRLVGSPLSDSLHGFDGRDVIRGGGDSDYLFGENGRDKIKGQAGFDTLDGGRGRDKLDGGAEIDTLWFAERSADILVKLKDSEWTELKVDGRVEDLIRNFENVQGSLGRNKLVGNDGANLFRTNDADDTLKGRGGSDEFRSGEGLDKIAGGGGRDVFYFSDAPDANTIKTIKDFRPGSDTIALNFGELGPLINPSGLLDAAYFHRGASAADADDYIVYNPGNGRLYVDYDGAGGSRQVLLAKLDPGLDLANTDFQSYLL